MSHIERRWVPAPHDACTFLRGLDLFQDLSPLAVEHLAENLRWYTLRGGEVVFREGDIPDGLHVVYTGRLRIENEVPGLPYPRIEQELGPKSTFGEIALLTGHLRTATVVAARDSMVGWLSPDDFEELFHYDTSFALRLTRRLATWVTRRPSRDPRTPILTLQAGWSGVDAKGFAHELAALLEPTRSAAVVTSSDLEPVLGRGFAKADRLSDDLFHRWVQWLDELEARTDAILLVAEGRHVTWDALCQRQSDRVLVLANDEQEDHATPAFHRANLRLAHLRPLPTELVLWHQRESQPIANTAAWLRSVNPERHHHVRSWVTEDLHRLARRALGGTTAFVLSGGAARGFAHIGAVEELRRKGVTADHLGGTSMGAVISAQVAAGWSEEEQIERNLELWNRFQPHRSYTFPWLSIVSRHAAEAMLEEMFGSLRFEDLPIPCFATSTDLTTGEIVVHDRGRVARWLQPSISIPGIGPPIPTRDGHLLADGAVLDNLPVNTMRDRCRGRILAINAMPVLDPHIRSDYRDIPTFRQWFEDRWNRGDAGPHFPHIIEVVTRATMLPSMARSAESLKDIDLLIEPRVAGFALFDMSRVREIAMEGAQSVKDAEEAITAMFGPKGSSEPAHAA